MSWPFNLWLRVAVKRFGLAPSEFWDMPVGDWLALMKDVKSPRFDRARLDALLELYPDEGS